VKDASVIGIIVGSMGLTADSTNHLLKRLQTLIYHSGKKHYTFVMGRLNEAKLCNFPEIDVYCLISNEDQALIPPKTFHVPVVTPYELELGLGAHEWKSSYLNYNSRGYTDEALDVLIANVKRNQANDCTDEFNVEGNDVDGTRAIDNESTTLALLQSECRLTAFQDVGSVLFSRRDYKGLEFAVPEGAELSIKEGLYGIAAGYSEAVSGDAAVPREM